MSIPPSCSYPASAIYYRPAMSSNSKSRLDDEITPLLANSITSSEVQDQVDEVPTRLANRIYVSHFLSTWNSRVFEFGAVLYLATIFPGTLLPMSIYTLTRCLFAIVLAPAVGQYIDTYNRLHVVRLSIGEHEFIPVMGNWTLASFAAVGRCGILCRLLRLGHRTENAPWLKGGSNGAAGHLSLCWEVVRNYESCFYRERLGMLALSSRRRLRSFE
jgi:hypothetical protein